MIVPGSEEGRNHAPLQEKTQRITQQICKTGNTIFNIKNIEIDMDENVFVPISYINEARREALTKLEENISQTFKRNDVGVGVPDDPSSKLGCRGRQPRQPKISILLNHLNSQTDYTKIEDVQNIYIPFKYFVNREYDQTIANICNNFRAYIYLPAITRPIYEDMISENIQGVLGTQKIEGIIISSMSQLELLKGIDIDNLKLVANYTINIFNNSTIAELGRMGVTKSTISPELDKDAINSIRGGMEREVIVYGRTLLMTSEYCMIGSPKSCNKSCKSGRYVLKDRMGFEFPIYTDEVSCNSFIYNSKTTSIIHKELDVEWIRIDVLDESVDNINIVVQKHKNNERLEGEEYTSGNINRAV